MSWPQFQTQLRIIKLSDRQPAMTMVHKALLQHTTSYGLYNQQFTHKTPFGHVYINSGPCTPWRPDLAPNHEVFIISGSGCCYCNKRKSMPIHLALSRLPWQPGVIGKPLQVCQFGLGNNIVRIYTHVCMLYSISIEQKYDIRKGTACNPLKSAV